jgi:hypothetical protein
VSRPKKRAAGLPAPKEIGKSLGNIAKVLPGAGNSGDRICWRFQHVDNASPWGLDKLTPDEMAGLLNKLVDVESQTIRELFNNGEEPGKHYDAHSLPNKLALQRLTALNLGDMTRISRLRFGGKERLFGFLVENVFHVLWWDRMHDVWKTKR